MVERKLNQYKGKLTLNEVASGIKDIVESKFLTLSLNGETCQIHLRTWGRGPVTLFIHGWLHSSEIWNDTGKLLCRLSRVIAIDLPGFGLSPPLPERMVSLDSYATLLSEIILSINKDENVCSIVADSLGAVLVLKALSHVRLPLKLLLLSGCPSDGLSFAVRLLAKGSIISSSLRLLKKFPTRLSATIIKFLSLVTVNRLENVSPNIICATLQADPSTSEKLFAELCLFQYKNESFVGCQCGLSIVLRGQKDRIVSETTARRLADSIGAGYVEIPGVGHTPMVELPSAYCAALVKMLENKSNGI